jgi:hypothetical protein
LRGKIITADPASWIPLRIDRAESPAAVRENPDRPRSWTVKNQVIEFPAIVEIEGKRTVHGRANIVAPNAVARIALMIDGAESAVAVLEDPDRPRSGSIECKVIELAAVVVIEGK